MKRTAGTRWERTSRPPPLLASLTLGAGTDTLAGPDGDAPPAEEPPVQMRTVYDLRLIPERITTVGTCDLSFGSFARARSSTASSSGATANRS